eukprot:TCALIF_07486-PA protein Name:"Protein of unknown function" AED:0.36 eAED:0.37 QI:0/0/0/0.66/0/0/3/0/232
MSWLQQKKENKATGATLATIPKIGNRDKPMKKKCLFCHQPHLNFKCGTFKNKTLQERQEIVRKEYLCQLCLNKGHLKIECFLKICFGIAVGKNGTGLRVSVLLDTAATNSYICNNIRNYLQLPSLGRTTMIQQVLNGQRTVTYDKVEVILQSPISNFEATCKVMVTKDIVTVPPMSLPITWQQKDLALDYPTENIPIDILLGADSGSYVMTGIQQKLQDNITMFHTHFGNVL